MFLATLLAAVLGLGTAGPPALPALPFAETAPRPPATFARAGRSVTNWRDEAARALHPAPLAWLAWLDPGESAFVARCVRLNNYWCIKRAAWPGEIGADAEGHTAFADAEAGADAAATLLRRYYVDYGRRSALAIVRRWAPAECAGPIATAASGAARSGAADGLAVHGLGRTLRARFLARHTRGGLARGRRPVAARANRRVQPYSALARLAGNPRRPPRPASARPIGPTPRAAAGPALTPIMDGPDAPTTLALLDTGPLPALQAPPPLCASDSARIANYAARIAGSVGLKPGDDLHLFDRAGRPQPTLAPVMLAMSGVELGTLRARAPLVAAAVARATPPP
jgi:hypothetical protein